jgi:hypothetical protein
MDRIRRALDERRVSYFGISWGTYLGPVYRALFPQNVDRMVLDSSVDPTARGYDDFRLFSIGMEDRWPDLARTAIEHRGTVRFGDTPATVRASYLAVAARLDQRPVPVAGTAAPLNGNFLRLHTFLLSYGDAALEPTPDSPVPPLMALWRAAANFADGTATAADAALITTTANDWIEGAATLPGIPTDNLFSVGWAISCGDTAFPGDLRTYLRNTAADRLAHPLTAGAPANVQPCSFWKTRHGTACRDPRRGPAQRADPAEPARPGDPTGRRAQHAPGARLARRTDRSRRRRPRRHPAPAAQRLRHRPDDHIPHRRTVATSRPAVPEALTRQADRPRDRRHRSRNPGTLTDG